MKLSIIIVNYKVKQLLAQCLQSVMAASKELKVEIFVIDNHSQDGFEAYLKPLFPTVIYITNPHNVGFSKANNQAIALATGAYLLFLNPDTVIGENTLLNSCTFMDQHPQTGGLGVKMVDGYGTFLPESKRGFPSPWNSFCKMAGLSTLFPTSPLFAQYHLRYLAENEEHQVAILAGAFMLVRKKVLDQIGSFDEAFFMYGEDIDLSYRIIQAGYTNHYLPQPIIHYKGESTKKDTHYVRIFYNAMILFFKKHYRHASAPFSILIQFAIHFHASIAALKLFLLPKKRGSKRIETSLLLIAKQSECDQILLLYQQTAAYQSYTLVDTAVTEAMLLDYDEIVFSTTQLEYQAMIALMDSCVERRRFHIYHPTLNLLIASNVAGD